jgi:hypothetical protein
MSTSDDQLYEQLKTLATEHDVTLVVIKGEPSEDQDQVRWVFENMTMLVQKDRVPS